MVPLLGVKQREEELFLLKFGKTLKQLRRKKGLSKENVENDCNTPIK